MKKAIMVLAFVLGAMTSANAFTITKMGEVPGYQHNEILNKMLKSDVKVYSGVDPDGYKLTSIWFDTGLKTLKMSLWYPVEGDSAVDEKEYKNWKYIIDKSIEWGQVAMENKVDHSESLGDCSTYKVKCSAKFSAISEGTNSWVTFDIESKDNQFYKASKVIFISDMKTLNDLFNKKSPEHWKSIQAKPKVEKAGLFQK